MADMDSRQRVESLVGSIDEAREELLGFDPPWMDPGYETMKIEVDRRLRNAQLAIAKLFEEASVAPTIREGVS